MGRAKCFCAAGALDHGDLVRRIDARLGMIGEAKFVTRQPASWAAGRKLVKRDLEQSHVVFGLPTAVENMADRFSLMALSTLYGGGMSSRLFQQVREKRGLCYWIFSSQLCIQWRNISFLALRQVRLTKCCLFVLASSRRWQVGLKMMRWRVPKPRYELIS